MLQTREATVTPSFVRLAAHPLRWRLLTQLAGSDYRVRELAAALGQPQNLVSYHLRRLRDACLVAASRSSADGRDSYYHLDLGRCAEALAETASALHPALRSDRDALTWEPASQPAVLFVCTGNSVRSPIAEALLRRCVGGHVAVASAGVRPKPRLHPNTVRVLREAFGVDVANHVPRALESLSHREFDYVITLCDRARDQCPQFDDDVRRAHWSIPEPPTTEPDETSYPAFERTAAEIDTRVRWLLPILAAS